MTSQGITLGRYSDEIAALKTQNEQLRALIPSRSHAVMDVAYHSRISGLPAGTRTGLWQFYFNQFDRTPKGR